MFAKYVEQTTFGPGPAAYDSLSSLKNVILRNKPKFQYYTEEGVHNSLIRKTMAAKVENLNRLHKSRDQLAHARTQAGTTTDIGTTASMNAISPSLTPKAQNQHISVHKLHSLIGNQKSHSNLVGGSKSRNNIQATSVSKTQKSQILQKITTNTEQLSDNLSASRKPVLTVNLLDRQKEIKPTMKSSNAMVAAKLSPSKSTSGFSRKTPSQRNHRSSNLLHAASNTQYDRKGAGQHRAPIDSLVNVHSPSPGQYDNFKTFYDRGKRRNFTIGKKFAAPKQPLMPGPANYDTRQVLFVTRGGSGNHGGQKWSFGTESRGINKHVITQASQIPACTDYSPACNNGGKNKKIKITFGQKLLDILNHRPAQSPGPGKYRPDHFDLNTQVNRKLRISKPIAPPPLRPKLFL